MTKDEKNKKILRGIAKDEMKHYGIWKKMTGCDVKPNKLVVLFYTYIARIFGLTFGIKLLERMEKDLKAEYGFLEKISPEAKTAIDEGEKHEKMLIGMIDEERLKYMGSIVLGLNDALVELTGALAGLSFAFQNTQLIALSGLVTGIAASMSMASSEYLSAKTEGNPDALKSSAYTGMTYIVTVFLLVLPYLLIQNYMISLALMLCITIVIIMFFNFYISVANDLNFKRRFAEMAAISMGVSAISFVIGIIVKSVLGISF